jgi:signal transduction histidine kinase
LNTNNFEVLIAQANNTKLDKTIRLKCIDSAETIINNRNNYVENKKKYFDLAKTYYNLNDYEKSNKIYHIIYSKSYQLHDLSGIAESNFYIGEYNYNHFNYDSSYSYFSKSEKAYNQLKEENSLGYVFISKSNILSFKKDFSGSEVLAIKALKIAQKINDYLLIYNCYITLGNDLTGMNNEEKAIEYYNKAFDITKNLKSESNYLSLKAQPYNYLNKVYQKKSDYKKAILFAKKALQFDDFKNKDIVLFCNLTNNMAYSKFKIRDKSCFYSFIEILKTGTAINNVTIQINSKINLAEYYLDQKDTLKALFYGKDAWLQAKTHTIFEDELRVLKQLAKIDLKNSAFYNERFIKLTDSLQNNERATRDKFARIEFETDEITKEKKGIETEKEKLSLQRWLIAGISIVTILFGISLFYNRNQRAKTKELQFSQEQQRANEEIYKLLLAQQQKIEDGKQIEKQRISLELHDGVMGKLAAVRMNLYPLIIKANPENSDKFLKQLDDIQAVEKEIRNIAHDLNTNLFADNVTFTSVVKALFEKIENHSQINFTLQVEEHINWEKINNKIKMTIYRILQEALQNTIKYAYAKNVTVTIIKLDQEIAIEIADDGKGFNTLTTNKGIGIENMKTRITKLKGQFSIQSELEKGTKINLIIPV